MNQILKSIRVFMLLGLLVAILGGCNFYRVFDVPDPTSRNGLSRAYGVTRTLKIVHDGGSSITVRVEYARGSPNCLIQGGRMLVAYQQTCYLDLQPPATNVSSDQKIGVELRGPKGFCSMPIVVDVPGNVYYYQPGERVENVLDLVRQCNDGRRWTQ